MRTGMGKYKDESIFVLVNYPTVPLSNVDIVQNHTVCGQYTLKNRDASKGSSSDAIEEPFLVPQRTIQSIFL